MALALVFLVASALVSCSFAIPVEKPAISNKYRLPTIIKPQTYDITLKLGADFMTSKKFTGTVVINFNVDKGQTTKEVKLHSKSSTINSVTLTKNDNDKTPVDINDGPYPPDPVADFLTITSKTEDLTDAVGYILTIVYDGQLQDDKSMMGFYLSTYKDGETVKYIAATQFEPTAARQAFPCFDEPSFKATFTLTISYPKGYNAISNTVADGTEQPDGDDLMQIKFKPTPKMSTYLVAFVVSEYTCTAGSKSGQATTEVCSRKATEADREVAKTLGPKVLDLMNTRYTKVAYEKKNSKLSQIAIPDFKLGAMENWGAVTFRERDILWNKDESSNKYKQSVVTVIAHELSHQWFGDLVTLDWWTNTFLNEGFGTYFQYHVPDQIPDYNTWRLVEQFVVEQVQTGLEADALITSLALGAEVDSPDTDRKFDTISYNKGGSMLRMVHHFVEEANFIKGLQKYISDKSDQNTVPDDLWSSFDTVAYVDGVKVKDMMQIWTKSPGYPVLTVKASGDDITISQKRFLTTTGTDDTKWFVPISYTLSTDTTSSTKTKQVLKPTEELTTIAGVLKGVDWIVLNNEQTGFYRVDYDDVLLKKISTVLSSTTDSAKITAVNKAQIVDDLFALARVGTKKYASVLDVLTFLTAETDYIPWYAAFRGFDFILRHTGDAATQKLMTAHILKLMDKLYKSIDLDTEKPDDQIYTLNQVQALTWACKLNEATCVKTAKAMFANYISTNEPQPVTKNFKSIVYCNGLRYSTDAGKDFDALWAKYGATDISTEQVTILNGLGCAKDDASIQKYLTNIITPASGIRINDAAAAFSSIYTSSPEGVASTLSFLIEKYADIKTYFGSTTLIKTIVNDLTDRFTSQAEIDKLNKFVTDHTDLDEDVKTAIQNGVAAATANIKWATDFNAQIKSYFDDNGGKGDDDDDGASTVTLQLGALFGTVFVLIFQIL